MPDSVSKERRAEYNRRYRETHPGYLEKWRKENPEKWRGYARQYVNKKYKDRPDSVKVLVNKYHNTPLGRAQNLLTSYRQYDKTKGWETNITAERIKELITTGKCIYCGCDDWRVLGLDRVNNNSPHSIGNVVCCCRKCNVKRGRRTIGEYLEIISKDLFDDLGAVESNELRVSYPDA